MTRHAIIILILALAISGCGLAQYDHKTFYPDGRIQSDCKVDVWRNAVQVNSTKETLWLADGTRLEIDGGNEAPDKNVVSAMASFEQALAAAMVSVAKVFGF